MDFSGKKVMIIGAGLSGIAAANLLSGKGASITLFDANAKKALSEASIREKLVSGFDGRIVLGDIPEIFLTYFRIKFVYQVICRLSVGYRRHSRLEFIERI